MQAFEEHLQQLAMSKAEKAATAIVDEIAPAVMLSELMSVETEKFVMLSHALYYRQRYMSAHVSL